jgi:hypothetical protein
MATQNLIAATSNLPQVLVAQQVAATETTQYTCPANSAVKIATANLCNTAAVAVTVAISVVKTGGTAGNANRVLSLPINTPLAPGDSMTVTELVGCLLGPGDFVSAIASAATSVSLVISGTVSS